MKRIHGTGSALRRFLRGKGFYIALSCSLAAVGGAAWLGLHSAIDNLDQPDPAPNQIRQENSSPNDWSVPQKDKPADVNKPDVPADLPSSPEEAAPTTQSFPLLLALLICWVSASMPQAAFPAQLWPLSSLHLLSLFTSWTPMSTPCHTQSGHFSFPFPSSSLNCKLCEVAFNTMSPQIVVKRIR